MEALELEELLAPTEVEVTVRSPEQQRAAAVAQQLAVCEEEELEGEREKFTRLGLLYNVRLLEEPKVEEGLGRKLTETQLLIIAMYMEGEALPSICKDLEITRMQVHRVLTGKLGKALIAQWRTGLSLELQALLPKALKVVRETMESGNKELALKGVDRFHKLFALDEAPELEIKVNIVDARTRFLTGLRDLARDAEVIDAEVVEVEPSSQ